MVDDRSSMVVGKFALQIFGQLAQLGERGPHTTEVTGSIPVLPILLDSALLMQNELSLLIQLQDHDAHIDGLHEKAEELMPLIKAKNQKAESLKSALKVSKDKIQTQQLKRKEME